MNMQAQHTTQETTRVGSTTIELAKTKPHRDCQSVMQSTCSRAKQLVDDLDRLLDAAIRTGDKPAIEKLAEAKATMRLAAIDIKRARRLNKATQVMPFGR